MKKKRWSKAIIWSISTSRVSFLRHNATKKKRLVSDSNHNEFFVSMLLLLLYFRLGWKKTWIWRQTKERSTTVHRYRLSTDEKLNRFGRPCFGCCLWTRHRAPPNEHRSHKQQKRTHTIVRIHAYIRTVRTEFNYKASTNVSIKWTATGISNSSKSAVTTVYNENASTCGII